VGGGAAGAWWWKRWCNRRPDDLDLLALFSSQAAVALKNTRELERLRSGALAASGAWPPRSPTSSEIHWAGSSFLPDYLEQRLGVAEDSEGVEVARRISREVDHMTELVREITQFAGPPPTPGAHRASTVSWNRVSTWPRRGRRTRRSVSRWISTRAPRRDARFPRVAQGVSQLISNALEAMDDEGS